MDLRYEFDKIIETYGYPVLVVRQSKKLRCSCWNEKTQEADRACPACFGLGWNPIVEKHEARGEDTSVPETLGRLTQSGTFGNIGVHSRKWFMRPEAEVVSKDYVVDVEWKNGRPVYTGKGIYEISHVDETMKYEETEMIYKIAYCKDTPVQKNIRGIRIVEVQGIINYELALEDM